MNRRLKVGIIFFSLSIAYIIIISIVLGDDLNFQLRIYQNVTNPYSITKAAQLFAMLTIVPISYSIVFSSWCIIKSNILQKIELFLSKPIFKIKKVAYIKPLSFIDSLSNYSIGSTKGFGKFFLLSVIIDFSIYYTILHFSVNDLIQLALTFPSNIFFPWNIFPEDFQVVDSLLFVFIFSTFGPLFISIIHQKHTVNQIPHKNKNIISKIILVFFYYVIIFTLINFILNAYIIPSFYATEYFYHLYYRWAEFFVRILFTFGLASSFFVYVFESKITKNST